jgi:anti-anti-sigma factor
VDELARIDIRQDDEVVVAHVGGELDLSNVGLAKRELTGGVPNSALGLVLDLSDAEHLDSSGVYLLFELAQALERRRQGLCVVAPATARTSRVLFVTGVDRLVPLTDTVAEAVERVRAGS